VLDAGQEVGDRLQVAGHGDAYGDATELADGVVTHHLGALDLHPLLAGQAVQGVLEVGGGERRRVAGDELRVHLLVELLQLLALARDVGGTGQIGLAVLDLLAMAGDLVLQVLPVREEGRDHEEVDEEEPEHAARRADQPTFARAEGRPSLAQRHPSTSATIENRSCPPCPWVIGDVNWAFLNIGEFSRIWISSEDLVAKPSISTRLFR
jgi:hypothetical protein